MGQDQFWGTVGAVFSGLIILLGALFRYAVTAKEKELDFRIGKTEITVNNNLERQHQMELLMTRLEGQMLLLKKDYDTIRDTVERIDDQMLNKETWVGEIGDLRGTMERILTRIAGRQADSPTPFPPSPSQRKPLR